VAGLRVECETDDAGRRIPVRFALGAGPPLRVAELVDCWEGEDHRYFRIRTDDDGTWILRWDGRRDAWELHFYERGGGNRT
jgi:hypothetical protein